MPPESEASCWWWCSLMSMHRKHCILNQNKKTPHGSVYKATRQLNFSGFIKLLFPSCEYTYSSKALSLTMEKQIQTYLKSKNKTGKWSVILAQWFSLFLCFPLLPTEFLSIFCEGPIQLEFTICMTARHLQFETDQRGRRVEWGWECGVAKRKKLYIVCIFQVSTQQYVERQRENLFKVIIRQLLLERRSHRGERRMRHFSSHLYLYTSVKR